MMGSGKSTAGRRLSRRLSRPFVDTDAEIERRAGCSVADLFGQVGEERFRVLEAEVLATLLGGADPVVIATGGGIVLADRNRELLADAFVIWLHAEPRLLAMRVGDGSGRPLLADDPLGKLTELFEARKDLYAEVADHVLDLGDVRPGQVVDGLVALVEAKESV